MNVLIPRGSITETQLAPHLRKGLQTLSSLASAGIGVEQLQTSVDVVIGDALYINSGNKLALADRTLHDAQYIALSSGVIDSMITITRAKLIEYSNGETLIPGNYLYLNLNGKATQTPPTTNIFQIVGVVINSTTALLYIDQSYTIE